MSICSDWLHNGIRCRGYYHRVPEKWWQSRSRYQFSCWQLSRYPSGIVLVSWVSWFIFNIFSIPHAWPKPKGVHVLTMSFDSMESWSEFPKIHVVRITWCIRSIASWLWIGWRIWRVVENLSRKASKTVWECCLRNALSLKLLTKILKRPKIWTSGWRNF